MNTVFLLIGLLFLSYLGNLLVARRTGGAGVGSASGVEYAALGFVLGPEVFDLVSARDLAAFEPVVQVAIGWLAFAAGLEFAVAQDRPVRPASLALGSASAVLTASAVAAAAWFATRALEPDLPAGARLLVSGGLGAACSETARHAAGRTANGRPAGERPLWTRLNELAHCDGFGPILAVAALFALDPPRAVAVPMPLVSWPAATVALAILLGAGAALLVRSEMALEETWRILFGVALLAIGVAARLGASTPTVGFFLGLTLSACSGHRRELRAMVGPTERPILLPALLLAGARLDFRATPALPWIAASAIGARMASKIVVGWALAAGSSPSRKAGPLVGLSLASSGALAICVGLAFAFRFPGAIGDTVLAAALLCAAAGEVVGPGRLRRSLAAAGEIDGAAARAGSGRVPA